MDKTLFLLISPPDNIVSMGFAAQAVMMKSVVHATKVALVFNIILTFQGVLAHIQL